MSANGTSSEAGRDFWAGLSEAQRWELGDQLVLGSFDWREWGFERRPSATFMNAVDNARINWEIMLGASANAGAGVDASTLDA